MHNRGNVYNRAQTIARKSNKTSREISFISATHDRKNLQVKSRENAKCLVNCERHHEQAYRVSKLFHNSNIAPEALVLLTVEELTEKFDISSEEAQQMLAIAASKISPMLTILPVRELLSHNTKSVSCQDNNPSAKQNRTSTLLSSSSSLLSSSMSNVAASMPTCNSRNVAEPQSHSCNLLRISTGIDMLDSALMGGLRTGTLVELTGQSNSSTTELALRWSVQTACAAWSTINSDSNNNNSNYNNNAILLENESSSVSVHRQGVIWLHANPTPPTPAQIEHVCNHTLHDVMHKGNKAKFCREYEPLMWFRHVEEMDSLGNNDLAEIEQFVIETNKYHDNIAKHYCNEHHQHHHHHHNNNNNNEEKCEFKNTTTNINNASYHIKENNDVIKHEPYTHTARCKDMIHTERTSVSLIVIDNFTVLVRRAYSGSTSNDGIAQQMAIGQLMHRLKQFAEQCNMAIVIITQSLSTNLQLSGLLSNASEFGRVLEHAVNVRLALVEQYTPYHTIDRYIHVLKSPTCASILIPLQFSKEYQHAEARRQNSDDDIDFNDDENNNCAKQIK